jgi:hypothetical protein
VCWRETFARDNCDDRRVIFVPNSTAFDFASNCTAKLRPARLPLLLSIILNHATMDPQTQVDISSLSDADKKELNAVLTNEAQKSSIQQGECPYVYTEAQRNNASAILMS